MFDPKLLLPERIYALPGFEINIYFQNVVTVINPANFAFDVECEKGRCDALRWRWIPEDADVGEHKLKLSVWSDEGLLAEAETTVIVSPRNAGEGTTLTILQIGASCMAAAGHGNQLHARFQLPGNPKLVMLGSHAPGYGPVTPGGPANEAYGGWNWRTFFEKESSSDLDNDGLHPKRPYDVPSPFLFDRNGRKEFDFEAYLKTVCHGVRPDVVYFELGVNGIFLAKTDEEFEEIFARDVYPYMSRMLKAVRAALPEAVLGVELLPKGSWSQDAFGKNYGCLQSRRRWLLNADLLSRKYIALAKELDYLILPEYHNCDGAANYPVQEEPVYAASSVTVKRAANALHATPDGYSQWADCEYFFLKYLLARPMPTYKFLNPDEVLMHTPYLVLVKKDKVPQTTKDVLQGIENLWERIVDALSEDPETLEDQERSMNSSLREMGAWERISLKDYSYLDLLNPAVITADGWGMAPKIWHEELKMREIEPELWLTADDPQAQDPNLPYDLLDNLNDPLNLPAEYR